MHIQCWENKEHQLVLIVSFPLSNTFYALQIHSTTKSKKSSTKSTTESVEIWHAMYQVQNNFCDALPLLGCGTNFQGLGTGSQPGGVASSSIPEIQYGSGN